eukprot:SAG22_NODE_151_length_17414_cov_7.812128_10_plen_74_part_00
MCNRLAAEGVTFPPVLDKTMLIAALEGSLRTRLMEEVGFFDKSADWIIDKLKGYHRAGESKTERPRQESPAAT